MAQLILTRVQDPAMLLERAVAGLFPPAPIGDSPWPTLSAWIVLRQGGLRDDIHRLAAERTVPGWLENPIALFTELADRWGPDDPRAPLTEPERHSLLARLIDAHGASVFASRSADAWVPMLDRVIGELMGEDVDAEAFAAALEATATDRFSQDRAAVIGNVYREWRRALATHQRRDGRDSRVALAQAIAEDPTGFAQRLGQRREIRIVGLADLRGGWRPLLRALRESSALDRIEVLTSASFALDNADVDTVPLTEGASFDGAIARATVRLIEAADTAREMERVAVDVRALLDAGTPAHRIAVVAREARPAVDAVSRTLAAMGVPVTARRRTAIAHTAPARALLALLQVPTERWARHAIAEVAEHPLLSTGLDAAIINAIGFASALGDRTEWTRALEELQARALRRERQEDDPEDRRTPLPASARVADTLAAWTRVAAALEALEQERSFEHWCQWAEDTLADGTWGIAERLLENPGDAATWHVELRARDRIAALLSAWRDATLAFGGRDELMNAERFRERLQLILAQDLITMPETDAGVVVAEALAAGWRSFDYLFVVGMTAGAFPMRPAESALLDRDEREALRAAGIPLDDPEAWRAREQELFRVLVAAPRKQLTLSWPALDSEGREAARSAFVDPFVEALHPRNDTSYRMPQEQVLVPGFPIVMNADVLAQAWLVATREGDRFARAEAARTEGATVELTPYNGQIEDPVLRAWLAAHCGESRVWSATQLESLAKCPWQWFASRLLRVEERRDADDLLEPSVSGNLRHDALEHFFKTAADERGRPLLIGESDRAWVRAGIRHALQTAWDKALAKGVWLGPEATRAAQFAELLRSLERYLDFEMKFNDDWTNNRTNASKVVRSGFIDAEVEFGPVEVTGDGLRFRLIGRVDRVDAGVKSGDKIADASRYLTAIDYKSSKGSTPGAGEKAAWDDGIVLQIPLYAEALRQTFADKEVVRMEYRTLDRDPKRVHDLNLAPVSKGEFVADKAEEAREKLSLALDAAGRRVRAARDGVLPANPAPSAGCSPFCPALDICRIPGGPRSNKAGAR